MKFGERIKKTRESKGLSQSKIEHLTGLKREYLSKIENGDLTNPTKNTIERLAKGLGVHPSGFFGKLPDQQKKILELEESNANKDKAIERLTKKLLSIQKAAELFGE